MMFTEESLENVVIEYLKDIDYKYIHGSNLNRDNKEVLLLDRLEERLININKEIPAAYPVPWFPLYGRRTHIFH